MDTIWKFTIPEKELGDYILVEMPFGAEILCVAAQGDNNLCLWAEVETNNTPISRGIYICGTGRPLGLFDSRYIGTAFMPSGLVWHVYEEAA